MHALRSTVQEQYCASLLINLVSQGFTASVGWSEGALIFSLGIHSGGGCLCEAKCFVFFGINPFLKFFGGHDGVFLFNEMMCGKHLA